MWILLTKANPNYLRERYLVFHDNEGNIDKVLQDNDKQHWVPDLLDYSGIFILSPKLLSTESLTDRPYYKILHTFDSSDPVSYVKSLHHTHPELFI